MTRSLYWLYIGVGYLCIGEIITLFTALLMRQTVFDKKGQYAWYWVSARVLLWWVVLLIAFFYALSVPVRLVLERVSFAKHPANPNN
jgi:hypothetical protein